VVLNSQSGAPSRGHGTRCRARSYRAVCARYVVVALASMVRAKFIAAMSRCAPSPARSGPRVGRRFAPDGGVTECTRADLPGDHLTGVKSHPQLQIHTVAVSDFNGEPLHVLLNAQRRQTGTNGVILQRRWRTEHDDLVALALALDVSPATLLLPAETDGGRGHTNLSVTEEGNDYARRQIWNWLTARAPIDERLSIAPPSRSAVGFRLRAVPEGVNDFTRLLMSDEEKQKLQEWVSEESQESDGDD
jgi:hypothetical protein